MKNHTFLLKEGIWRATGVYFDVDQWEVPVEGETRIVHQKEVWINEGYMRLLSEKPLQLQNKYEIQPFGEGKDVTTWTSENPALGRLKGRFMVVGDSILSVYQSESGEYSGIEYLRKVSDTVYQNRGYALRGEEKLSSWVVELKAV